MKKSKCAFGISLSQAASPGGMRMNRFYFLFIAHTYKKIFPWLCPPLRSSSAFLKSLKVSPRWMAVRCLTHTPRLVCSLPPLVTTNFATQVQGFSSQPHWQCCKIGRYGYCPVFPLTPWFILFKLTYSFFFYSVVLVSDVHHSDSVIQFWFTFFPYRWLQM